MATVKQTSVGNLEFGADGGRQTVSLYRGDIELILSLEEAESLLEGLQDLVPDLLELRRIVD